ncbi:holocytochrome c synthase, partial [Ascosphaera aggregata]
LAVTVPNGPTLERFQGRPGDLTPRARVLGLLGKMFPDKFSDTPPFDRHDWYVRRETLRGPMTMRYVIDFYSLPPEPDGMPAFNVDVRPALDSPRAAMERFIVWAGDLWWRASGGVAREAERRKKELEQARGVRG